MRSDPIGILEAAIMALSLSDVESTTAFFDENADFAIHMPVELLPKGGKFIGRAAFAKRLGNIFRDFHTVRFELRTILTDSEGLRTQVAYTFRHRKNGETIDGVMRLLVSVSNGLIVRWHEFHDTDKVEAFLRLVESHGE